MMQELITLLGGVSVLAFTVTLVTSALGLRRRAIRRGLSGAEAGSPWWAWLRRGLSTRSLAAGGSGAPTPRHSRTSRVWRALLVLVWVAAIPPSSAFSPLPAHPDLAYTQSSVRLATNGAAASAQAEALSGEYQYYVPFNDVNLWTLFDDKDAGLSGAQQCHADGIPVAGTLDSSIFLVSSIAGTVYYYDHWEDGYDADPTVPGPTTLSGVLDAGEVANFQSLIDPALVGDLTQGDCDVGGTIHQGYCDGRDRITLESLVGASVVRLVSPSTPGVVLAAAWEVPEVSDWGTSFEATVGEDLDFSPGVDDHDFTGLEVMAALPGTAVYRNGVQVATLGPGQTFFIDGANDGPGGGGVDSTDVIDASAPVQVQMLTGGCGARYSAHGYTLRPVTEWGNEYWAPVPGFSCGDNVADSDIYLHNHNGYAIDITVVSDQGTVVVPIPGHITISLLDYVTNLVPPWEDISTGSTAVHLSSADPFLALAVIDSATLGRPGLESQVRDWGYTVIPVAGLSSQVVVGYAPGNRLLTDNGNSAFVAATRDTVLFVDLDQDRVPDAFDMNGDGDAADNDVFGVPAWDEPVSAGGIPLLRGQTTRVGDPNDRNLEGALIYSSGYQDKIAVAWGQDPCQAGRADPYLDLGYTVLPLAFTSCAKKCDLAVDADQSGDITPGDTLTWTLVLANSGLGSMNDVTLIDSPPYPYTDFEVGSLQVTTPPAVGAIEYSNDGINFDAPENADIQAFRIRWPTIGSEQVVTNTFLVTLHTDIAPSVTGITNTAQVDSADTDPFGCEGPCLIRQTPTPGISLSKECDSAIDADQSGDITPGDTLIYTLVLSNSGLGSMNNVVLTDPLPYAHTDFVVGSLQVTTPPPFSAIECSNDGSNFDAPPNPGIRAFRIQWPTIGPGEVVTVTFHVTIHKNIPKTVTEITNQAQAVSADTEPSGWTTASCPMKKNGDNASKTPVTFTPSPTCTSPPVTPTATVPPLTTVERLPETGGFPGWSTVFLGVSVLIGLASLLNLALLEMRDRRGDGKGG